MAHIAVEHHVLVVVDSARVEGYRAQRNFCLGQLEAGVVEDGGAAKRLKAVSGGSQAALRRDDSRAVALTPKVEAGEVEVFDVRAEFVVACAVDSHGGLCREVEGGKVVVEMHVGRECAVLCVGRERDGLQRTTPHDAVVEPSLGRGRHGVGVQPLPLGGHGKAGVAHPLVLRQAGDL